MHLDSPSDVNHASIDQLVVEKKSQTQSYKLAGESKPASSTKKGLTLKNQVKKSHHTLVAQEVFVGLEIE